MPSASDMKHFFDDVSYYLCRNDDFEIYSDNNISRHVLVLEVHIFIELTDDNQIKFGLDGLIDPFEPLEKILNRTRFEKPFSKLINREEDGGMRLYKYYHVKHDHGTKESFSEKVYLLNCVDYLEKEIYKIKSLEESILELKQLLNDIIEHERSKNQAKEI